LATSLHFQLDILLLARTGVSNPVPRELPSSRV